jgi:hypothetical protein
MFTVSQELPFDLQIWDPKEQLVTLFNQCMQRLCEISEHDPKDFDKLLLQFLAFAVANFGPDQVYKVLAANDNPSATSLRYYVWQQAWIPKGHNLAVDLMNFVIKSCIPFFRPGGKRVLFRQLDQYYWRKPSSVCRLMDGVAIFMRSLMGLQKSDPTPTNSNADDPPTINTNPQAKTREEAKSSSLGFLLRSCCVSPRPPGKKGDP